MKVTICDPNTFENKDVEIDELANNIALEVKDKLSEFLGGIWKIRTVTQLIYKEDGSITMGLMFRNEPGEESKKYRITIEKIQS